MLSIVLSLAFAACAWQVVAADDASGTNVARGTSTTDVDFLGELLQLQRLFLLQQRCNISTPMPQLREEVVEQHLVEKEPPIQHGSLINFAVKVCRVVPAHARLRTTDRSRVNGGSYVFSMQLCAINHSLTLCAVCEIARGELDLG